MVSNAEMELDELSVMAPPSVLVDEMEQNDHVETEMHVELEEIVVATCLRIAMDEMLDQEEPEEVVVATWSRGGCSAQDNMCTVPELQDERGSRVPIGAEPQEDDSLVQPVVVAMSDVLANDMRVESQGDSREVEHLKPQVAAISDIGDDTPVSTELHLDERHAEADNTMMPSDEIPKDGTPGRHAKAETTDSSDTNVSAIADSQEGCAHMQAEIGATPDTPDHNASMRADSQVDSPVDAQAISMSDSPGNNASTSAESNVLDTASSSTQSPSQETGSPENPNKSVSDRGRDVVADTVDEVASTSLLSDESPFHFLRGLEDLVEDQAGVSLNCVDAQAASTSAGPESQDGSDVQPAASDTVDGVSSKSSGQPSMDEIVSDWTGVLQLAVEKRLANRPDDSHDSELAGSSAVSPAQGSCGHPDVLEIGLVVDTVSSSMHCPIEEKCTPETANDTAPLVACTISSMVDDIAVSPFFSGLGDEAKALVSDRGSPVETQVTELEVNEMSPPLNNIVATSARDTLCETGGASWCRTNGQISDSSEAGNDEQVALPLQTAVTIVDTEADHDTIEKTTQASLHEVWDMVSDSTFKGSQVSLQYVEYVEQHRQSSNAKTVPLDATLSVDSASSLEEESGGRPDSDRQTSSGNFSETWENLSEQAVYRKEEAESISAQAGAALPPKAASGPGARAKEEADSPSASGLQTLWNQCWSTGSADPLRQVIHSSFPSTDIPKQESSKPIEVSEEHLRKSAVLDVPSPLRRRQCRDAIKAKIEVGEQPHCEKSGCKPADSNAICDRVEKATSAWLPAFFGCCSATKANRARPLNAAAPEPASRPQARPAGVQGE